MFKKNSYSPKRNGFSNLKSLNFPNAKKKNVKPSSRSPIGDYYSPTTRRSEETSSSFDIGLGSDSNSSDSGSDYSGGGGDFSGGGSSDSW